MEAKKIALRESVLDSVFLHQKVCNLSFECQPNSPPIKYFKDSSTITKFRATHIYKEDNHYADCIANFANTVPSFSSQVYAHNLKGLP